MILPYEDILDMESETIDGERSVEMSMKELGHLIFGGEDESRKNV